MSISTLRVLNVYTLGCTYCMIPTGHPKSAVRYLPSARLLSILQVFVHALLCDTLCIDTPEADDAYMTHDRHYSHYYSTAVAGDIDHRDT